MTVSGEWLDEAKAIYIMHYESDWRLDDFMSAVQTYTEAIRAAAVDTVMIHQLPEQLILPPGALSIIFKLRDDYPENIKGHYIIGGGAMARIVYRIVSRVTPEIVPNLYFVDAVEAALQLISGEADEN